MVKLTPIQEDKRNELVSKSEFKLKGNKICSIMFQAPTGFGKTIVMVSAIEELAKKFDDIVFFWVSLRQLHQQSKEKFEQYADPSVLKVYDLTEGISRGNLEPGDVLFFNWESVNRDDNIANRDTETGDSFQTLIDNIKQDGKRIVLIIDEQHIYKGGRKAIEVIQRIMPNLFIEISATPTKPISYKDLGLKASEACPAPEYVIVSWDEAKEDQVVVQKFVINYNIKDEDFKNVESTTEVLLTRALEQQKLLKETYKQSGLDINPLLVIQISDGDQGKEEKKEVLEILKKHGLTPENGKVVVWLSRDKTTDTLNAIKGLNNSIDVLIFKQALAVGWDCPRAQILVALRNSKSKTFTEQVLGRIARMPERKYYADELLNWAYIYFEGEKDTLLSLLTEAAEKDLLARNIKATYEEDLKALKAVRDNTLYRDLNLPVWRYKIVNAKADYRVKNKKEFKQIMKNVAEKIHLRQKINTAPEIELTQNISKGHIDNPEDIEEVNLNDMLVNLPPGEIDVRLTIWVEQLISEAENYKTRSSAGTVVEVLIEFIKEFADTKDEMVARKIILFEPNQPAIKDLILTSLEKYKAKLKTQRSNRCEDVEMEETRWEVPQEIQYKKKDKEIKAKKSILKPLINTSGSINQLEQDFIQELEAAQSVKWFFKNGQTRDAYKYLTIPYTSPSDDTCHNFHPDFVVEFITRGDQQRELAIYEIKAINTVNIDANTKAKAKALQEYIKKVNNHKDNYIKVSGGFVMKKSGKWMINTDPDLSDDKWEELKL